MICYILNLNDLKGRWQRYYIKWLTFCFGEYECICWKFVEEVGCFNFDIVEFHFCCWKKEEKITEFFYLFFSWNLF